MREIEYSSKRFILSEIILVGKVAGGDYEALLALILARTDLTREEALELDMAEVQHVLEMIKRGIDEASALSKLGKGLSWIQP